MIHPFSYKKIPDDLVSKINTRFPWYYGRPWKCRECKRYYKVQRTCNHCARNEGRVELHIPEKRIREIWFLYVKPYARCNGETYYSFRRKNIELAKLPVLSREERFQSAAVDYYRKCILPRA